MCFYETGRQLWVHSFLLCYLSSPLTEPFAAYAGKRAARYDSESTYDKGDRQRQYQILVDVVRYAGRPHYEFCDLGCGTGYFTRAFFEVDAQCRGIALDASSEMLDVARAKLQACAERTEFVCLRFEDIPWPRWRGQFDVVFSALAIHHLDDRDKWRLFGDIAGALRPDGIFILYDLIRHRDPRDGALIEHLACRDMQRRLMAYLDLNWEPPDLSIEAIIEKDRFLRAREGDNEAPLDDQLQALVDAGFSSTVLFQDARIVGLCCRKAPVRCWTAKAGQQAII